jgi:threonine synthase
MMSGLKQSGSFEIPAEPLARLQNDFTSGRADEEAVKNTIAQTLKVSGKLIDPHTAVACHVAQQNISDTPMITLSTAHPAKFPEAVEAASGIHPQLPAHLADLFERVEKFDVLPNDLTAVEGFIAK